MRDYTNNFFGALGFLFIDEKVYLVSQCTVLPNIYIFPLMELPENESYSGHGDDHTINFS